MIPLVCVPERISTVMPRKINVSSVMMVLSPTPRARDALLLVIGLRGHPGQVAGKFSFPLLADSKLS